MASAVYVPGVVLLLAPCAGALAQVQTVEAVAVSGDPAPGVPGAHFVEFGAPAAGAFGEVAFLARIGGPGVVAGSDVGLWGGPHNALTIVAREGDQAPGTAPGEVFGGTTILNGMQPFGQPTVGERGEIAFRASLLGPTVTASNDEGLWWGLPGPPLLVAREQAPISNAPGVQIERMWFQPVTAGPPTIPGWALLQGAVTPQDDSAIIMTTGPGVEIIAREGSPVPGINAEFAEFGAGQVRSVSLGRYTAFTTLLRGPLVTQVNNEAVVSYHHGQLAVIAREGSPAPGPTRSLVHAGMFQPPYTAESPGMSAARCVFLGRIDGPGITFDNDEVVWHHDQALGLSAIAIEDQAAPGIPGVRLGGSFSAPVVSDGGRVVFTSFLRGQGVTQDNDLALFESGPGAGLRLLAREGDQAPGLAPGIVYADHFSQIHARVGGSSLVAFQARLDGAGVTPGVDDTAVFGVWGGPVSHGRPHVMLRAGDSVAIRPGMIRTVESIGMLPEGSGGADGRASSIIGNVRLATQLSFTNGESGIFIVDYCYASCGGGPLSIFSFLCFQNAFVSNDPYADCDGNGVLDIFDFLCFQNAFQAGC